MIERVEHPYFSIADFDPRRRVPGISAIVRVKNEAEFVEQAVTSILPYADDIVITFNDCTDATPEIVAELARREPEQIRAYEYVPRVFPAGSDEQRKLPPNHVNSFVFYTNFALSLARCRVCFMWDGDQIAIPEAFTRIVRRIRTLSPREPSWWFSPWMFGFWYYQGVNLWAQQGKLCVIKKIPLMGQEYDHGFWTLRRWTRYRHERRFPILMNRWLWRRRSGVLFYHLKHLKHDHGYGVYQLDRYPNSYFQQYVASVGTEPELISLEELARVEPSLRGLSPPEALGIRPVS